MVLIVLGFTGFVAQSNEGVDDRTLLDNLYLTLQLAVLSYGGGGGDLNWRLEVAALRGTTDGDGHPVPGRFRGVP